jgi:hypothetical protein
MSNQAAIIEMIEPKLQVDGFLRKNKSRFERKQPDSDFVCFLEFETNTIRGVDRTDAHFGVQWAQFSKIAYEMYKSGPILLPDLKDDMSCIIKGPKQLRLWYQEKTGIFKFQKFRFSREVDDIETYCSELVEIFKGCALPFFDEWSS